MTMAMEEGMLCVEHCGVARDVVRHCVGGV